MNRTLHHTTLFSMLGGLALSAAAFAGGDDMFTMADANKDGRISAQEHATAAQARFARMDANRDGRLAADEMAVDHGMKKMHAGMMAKMDANHDGVLTRAEHAAAAQAMFDRMDPDHDGKVTAAEMSAAHQRMMGGEHAMAPGGKGHDGMQHAGMDDHAKPMGDHKGMQGHAGMRDKMDANKDGVVTTAEHAAAAKAMFARMDGNNDGYVSKVEMEAGRTMKKTSP